LNKVIKQLLQESFFFLKTTNDNYFLGFFVFFKSFHGIKIGRNPSYFLDSHFLDLGKDPKNVLTKFWPYPAFLYFELLERTRVRAREVNTTA
jgi:hypothetical protein